MTYIRLAILDDHKLVRKGFCLILNNIPDFNVLLETDNEEEIVELVKNDCPDILLLDISMPDSNGLELIPKLLKINKDLKIIMLTMHKEGEYIIKAVKNGACSYLLKDVEPDELEEAIRTVYDKNKYFSPFISELLIDNISKPKEIGKISEREKEILQYVAQGLSTKLIAEKLNISTRTVEAHRMKIMKKVKASNSAELIKKAIQHKLIN
ncbi:MAG TPA: response regulator transcription factor [Cytophagaceae bacterium]|jgi:DNA-binding NarL/FixJ family response regulator|nr:response regulator transcription factor [Cytophagaceae bacterium]